MSEEHKTDDETKAVDASIENDAPKDDDKGAATVPDSVTSEEDFGKSAGLSIEYNHTRF